MFSPGICITVCADVDPLYTRMDIYEGCRTECIALDALLTGLISYQQCNIK